MKKRLLAMIMAFVMAMSLLPMSALAGGTTTPATINVDIYTKKDGTKPSKDEKIDVNNLQANPQTLTCGTVYTIAPGQLYELDFKDKNTWEFDNDGIKKLVVFQGGTEESEIRQVLGPSAKIEDDNKIFNNKKLHADTVFYQEFGDDNDDNEWECVVYNTNHGWLDTSQTKHALFGTWSLSCTVNGATALKVSKTLSGRDWKDDDSFSFTLTPSVVTNPMPAGTGNKVTVTKENPAGAFGDITFTKAGTYVYTVTEDATTIGGVTKDSTVYTVTVTVTDNSAGQLTAAVSYEIGDKDYTYGDNGMTFTNTYRASSVVVPGGDSAGKDDGKLEITKSLSGREWQADDAFTFRIAAVTEGAPMPVSKTITLTKDKTSGAFGDITFTKAGTYVYTVTEDATTIGGVTKDSTVYTVTVTVTDNSAGQLVAAVSYKSGDTDYTYGDNGMTFTNTYSAGSVVVPGGDSEGEDNGKLEVIKILNGRNWKDNDKFTFTIAAKTENAPMPAAGTIELTKDKTSGAFGDITFTQAGVYEYTITETKGTISNVTYDTTVYTVKVTVTDGGNGQLSAAVAYTSSTGEFDYTLKDGMTFTNTYTKPVKPSKPPVLNKEDHYAYVVGYPDGTVKPQGNITRAEVATIFFRMLTDDSRNEFWSQTNSYSDVSEGQWFNNAISTLANAGILSGYPDGTFRPNAPITRAEFTKIAASFFEQVEYTIDNPFNDVDDDDWFYKFVMAAYEDGLITGYPEGDFRPNANINRAEAMTIVNRTLGRAPDADHFLKDMIVWPDNPKSAWYYEAVQEATNSHEYVMKGTGTNQYEEWTKILEVRDWPALEKEWSDANSAAGGEVVK